MLVPPRRIALGVVLALLPFVAGAQGSAPRRSPAREGANRCPEGMVALPGGTFGMRARGDTVRVGPLCMDVTEVTAGAYQRCVEAGKCALPRTGGRCTYGVIGKADHPANCVDWNEAVAFCSWARKRLPTEEEWEWAARGAKAGTTFPWGDGDPDEGFLCWKRSDEGTCPVGSTPGDRSPQGVADLAGNVAEWTEGPDKYTSSPGRVNCGGTWINPGVARLASATSRGIYEATSRVDHLGFRCARTP